MFGKIFEQTFTGSMFGKGPTAFAVLAYIIANTKPDHHIELNPSLLSAIIGAPEDEIKAVIQSFCAPDPASRSKEHDGKRLIKKGEFLYFVTGHERFAGCKTHDQRREYMRVYMKQRRKR